MSVSLVSDRNSFQIDAAQAGKFNRAIGSVGQRRTVSFADFVKTLVNSNPEAKQVSTVTVTASPTSSHEFIVVVNGQNVSYTSDASATRAEVTSGLLAALQADIVAGGAFDYSANTSTGVITCTARIPAMDISISSSDSDLTVATGTAAASADPIPFGVGTIILGTYANGSQLAGLASQANLVAQVDTIAVVYASGESYTVQITIEGETYVVTPVAANTDDATTAQAIVDAINAIMPANSVLASRSTANVVLTAEVKGKAFVTGVGTKSGTAARMVLTHTTASLLTDITKCFGGVAELGNNMEGVYTTSSDVGATSWKPNAGFPAVQQCLDGIYVDNSETPTDSDAVYIETATGSNAGKFYTTTDTYRIKLPATKFRWVGDPGLASDGLGLLAISR